MSEQEITKTHFSENWAVEQVATYVPKGINGWAAVPHILRALPPKHRRSAFDALRIAHTLRLIDMEPAMTWSEGDAFDSEEIGMCPQNTAGKPLLWARVKR
jgi:hypothetical protein